MRLSSVSGVLLLSAGVVGCKDELPSESILDSEVPTIAAVRPPPISGGTLLVTRDGARAVVSDPERDRVVLVDLSASGTRVVTLQPGDEPGRSVEDDVGRVHVATRSGGALVSIDLESGEILGRRDACSSPRGVAFDTVAQALHVACASGELVSFPVDPSASATRRLVLEPDLRDVVVRDSQLLVSTFRAANLLVVDAEGAIVSRAVPHTTIEGDVMQHVPHVAWRMLPLPGGGAAMVHQMQLSTTIFQPLPEEEVDGVAPYQGGSCEDRLVNAELSLFDADGVPTAVGPATFQALSLPVDLALSADGERAAVVEASAGQVVELRLQHVSGDGRCADLELSTPFETGPGTPVALAYWGTSLLVQFREPAHLGVFQDGSMHTEIDLGGESRTDTGFELFHNTNALRTASGLACASCHPEGRDDGHVWAFEVEGPRRTQSLAGTIAGTAPYHWQGNLDGMQDIMNEVFTTRMGGPTETPARVDALQSWLEALEPVRAAVDPDQAESVERGHELFRSEEVGCASCHSGSSFTNNQNADIGREEDLQVPSLVGLGVRAPFMHDGCAATLLDRFDSACGGDDHGDTSQLDEDSMADLIAYLSSL